MFLVSNSNVYDNHNRHLCINHFSSDIDFPFVWRNDYYVEKYEYPSYVLRLSRIKIKLIVRYLRRLYPYMALAYAVNVPN